MLSDQRQYEMSEWICREGKASIAELAEHFGVSGETIRRDLAVLAKEGKIRKVHGGAVAVRHPVRDQSYAIRQQQSSYNKQKIGEYAASLLRDGDIIGIDSGTSAESFARAIYHVRDLKVVTHSMPVAAILADKLSAGDFEGSVLLLSGTVNPETHTLGGSVTLTQLQGYHMDKSFIAATALSASGVMAGTEQDGWMSATLLRQSECAYVIAESEKLDRQSFFKIADYDELHGLITDDEHPMSAELAKIIAESGTELHTVSLTKHQGESS